MTEIPVIDPSISDLLTELIGASTGSGMTRAQREEAVASALAREIEEHGYERIAALIGELLDVDQLVPVVYQRWRPLVRDSLTFFGSHLSLCRLASKLVEQIELPIDTPRGFRLLRWLAGMPGLQKLGQVLSSDGNLDPELRNSLVILENGITEAKFEEIQQRIVDELGPRLDEFGVQTDAQVLSEGTVAAVVRFAWTNPATRLRDHGVFKVLKPGIESRFAEDMRLFEELAAFLSAKAEGYGLVTRDFPGIVVEIRQLLEQEIDFPNEQRILLEASRIYDPIVGIRVPRLIGQLCSPRVTAMSAQKGLKVTEAAGVGTARAHLIIDRLVEGLVSVPYFSPDSSSLYHADPHPGNLLYDPDTRELKIVDWALTGRLGRADRSHLTVLLLTLNLRDTSAVWRALSAMSNWDDIDEPVLRSFVQDFVHAIPALRIAGISDVLRCMDGLALRGMRFNTSLHSFRKAMFTLEGILQQLAGRDVSLETRMAGNFVTRMLFSYGAVRLPLGFTDWLALQRSIALLPLRACLSVLQASEIRLNRRMHGIRESG